MILDGIVYSSKIKDHVILTSASGDPRIIDSPRREPFHVVTYSIAIAEQFDGPLIGGLRRPFLSWISEFPTHRISMSVNHWHPRPALNPETSKKE
jgi:hypothetical protein